jgi:hypothetical protein
MNDAFGSTVPIRALQLRMSDYGGEKPLLDSSFSDSASQIKLQSPQITMLTPQIAIQDIDSINPFASRKSAVSKPSVNHSKIGINNSGARDSLA